MAIYQAIKDLVQEKPGLTETEIAHCLPNKSLDRIAKDCRWLVSQNQLKRHGVGGEASPYRYYAIGVFRPS